MTINYPGPYELRFNVSSHVGTGGVLQHKQRVNIDLVEPVPQGTAFNLITIKDKSSPGGSVFLDILVEQWLTVLAPLFNTAFSFGTVELWKYPTVQSFDSVFWSSYGPPTAQPSSATTPNEAGQAVYTFRTAEGGVMKLSLMETVSAAGVPQEYSAMSAANKAVVDFVLGGGAGYDAPFLGRDTSYPFAFIRFFPGRNEALFKRRFR